LTIGRALAKTITFRTIATVMDFTTIYVVVGDLATTAGLSAFGFVVGPDSARSFVVCACFAATAA